VYTAETVEDLVVHHLRRHGRAARREDEIGLSIRSSRRPTLGFRSAAIEDADRTGFVKRSPIATLLYR
jgi:hypothetical protein